MNVRWLIEKNVFDEDIQPMADDFEQYRCTRYYPAFGGGDPI